LRGKERFGDWGWVYYARRHDGPLGVEREARHGRGLDVVDEMKVWRIVGDLSAGLGVCLIGVVPSING
jgi:hypothetical protein